MTSLATLALIEAGEPVDSPVIQKSLDYLRKLSDPKMTYCAALQILAMDIRAVDQVAPLTLERAQPADATPPFSGLPADGTTADWYRGSGAASNAVLTVTVSANVADGWPSQYTKVTPDGDATTFGTQIQAQADGTFQFWVQRPVDAARRLRKRRHSAGLSHPPR